MGYGPAPLQPHYRGGPPVPTRGATIEPFEAVSWPGRVVFGAGCVARVPDEVAELGLGRILVVHGRSATGVADQVLGALGPVAVGRVSEVAQHVPEDLAVRAVRAAEELDADGLVTIGGGSATGLGKAIALELCIPIVAVPTTYAGSEMTPIYGITGDRKRTGRATSVLPTVVIYDPELTVAFPPAASAASGMNAMAQAVESLWASPVEPVTTLLGEEAVRVLAAALPRVVATPDDLDARGDALYGAFLAGTCLARSATGLHHKLCHAIGGSYGLPHAAIHAVILPHVAAFNAEAAPDTAARIATALDATDPAVGLHALNARLGNDTGLQHLGFPEEGVGEVAAMVAPAVCEAAPRPADEAQLRSLLHRAYTGAPPSVPTATSTA